MMKLHTTLLMSVVYKLMIIYIQITIIECSYRDAERLIMYSHEEHENDANIITPALRTSTQAILFYHHYLGDCPRTRIETKISELL